MQTTINHAKNCLAEIINYTLFVMVEIAFLAYLSTDEPGFFTYAVLALIPLAYYFVRCYVHRIWLFALLHLLPLVLVFGAFDHDIAQKALFFVAAAVQAIVSLAIRIDIYSESPRADYGVTAALPPVAIVFGLIMFLLTRYDRILALTIVFIALYLFYHYLGQFLYYTDMNRRTTGHVPAGEIFNLNIILVGAFTLISVLVMAGVAGQEVFSAFARWLYNTVSRFLRWLASLLPSSGEGGPAEELAAPPAEEAATGLPFTEAPEPLGLLAQIIEQALVTLATILFYALLAAALWGLFVLIRAAFRRRFGKEKTADGEGDLVEIIARPVRKAKEKRRRLIFAGADERIRGIFARVVERRFSEQANGDTTAYILLHSGTARELLALFDGEPEPARALVALYEKARYACESCTGADVREARRLAGRVRGITSPHLAHSIKNP
ncbi:MAG: hypothetical protein LBI54_05630 [Lachnospiraceae bacterium]|jgi:hypothetical protein|nr:hypothetical protein [Lachnospiraceae bacterium]